MKHKFPFKVMEIGSIVLIRMSPVSANYLLDGTPIDSLMKSLHSAKRSGRRFEFRVFEETPELFLELKRTE